jgi:hypothetical protein
MQHSISRYIQSPQFHYDLNNIITAFTFVPLRYLCWKVREPMFIRPFCFNQLMKGGQTWLHLNRFFFVYL